MAWSSGAIPNTQLEVDSIHTPHPRTAQQIHNRFTTCNPPALIIHKQLCRAAWFQTRLTMETDLHNSPDFALYVYRKQNFCDNTLDDAQLETRCPLDNGRHDCTSISICVSTSQLDRLPLELLIKVLLQLDIPSLTRFRCLNRRAMALVNSVHEYTAIIKHCPNIIRAIVSIQADAFDCSTLYRTLCTSRCATCNRFGNYLYLIDCRRVCYFCFTRRVEYFPLTSREAYKFFTKPQSKAESSRKLLELANPPSILSLPGRYCSACVMKVGGLRVKRLQLYDRRAVVQSLAGSGLPKLDKTTTEPKRFMAIISAPVLLDAGLQVDHGFFCLGCWDETDEKTKHFRIKYTTEDMSEHIAIYGRVERRPSIPGRFMHIG